jgi:hypothetical protein
MIRANGWPATTDPYRQSKAMEFAPNAGPLEKPL